MNDGQGIMLYLCLGFQDIPSVSVEFASVKMELNASTVPVASRVPVPH